MVEFGITEVRHVLKECDLAQFYLRSGYVKDDDLLKVNLLEDYGLDSLDFEEMCSTVWYEYKIKLEDNAMDKSSFREEPTVDNFINMVNAYGYYLDLDDDDI